MQVLCPVCDCAILHNIPSDRSWIIEIFYLMVLPICLNKIIVSVRINPDFNPAKFNASATSFIDFPFFLNLHSRQLMYHDFYDESVYYRSE